MQNMTEIRFAEVQISPKMVLCNVIIMMPRAAKAKVAIEKPSVVNLSEFIGLVSLIIFFLSLRQKTPAQI